MLIFETVAGSHLYGTNTPASDLDVRGICFEPVESLIGLNPIFEQRELEGDHIVYGLKKFLRLALQNNPNILDILFAPHKMWRFSSVIWQDIYDQRHLFLSESVRYRFTGYAYSEMHKIENSLNTSNTYKRKHAAHLLRIALQGMNILKSGTYDPVLIGDDLVAVQNVLYGTVSIESVLVQAKTIMADLEYTETQLPEKPTFDTLQVVDWYRQYLKHN